MKSLLKQTTAILLALFIVLSMLPVGAAAEESTVMPGVRAVHTVTFEADSPTVFLVADGMSLETLPAAPEKSAADFMGWYDGDEKITAPFTPGKDTVLLARYEDWDVRTLDARAGGILVSVTGKMPSGSRISVKDRNEEEDVTVLKSVPVKPLESGEELPEETEEAVLSLYSCEISIRKEDNSVYQPEPDNPVTVTVSGDKIAAALAEGRSLRMTRAREEGTKEIIPGITVHGDAVSFRTDFLSVFDVDAAWNMAGIRQELMEGMTFSGRMPASVKAEASAAAVDHALTAFDLSFRNFGRKVEPSSWNGTGMITMQSDAIARALANGNRLTVIHETEKGQEKQTVQVLEDGSICFTAQSSGVYAILETIVKKTLTASDGTTYEIQVSYTEENRIPMEGTALLVKEVLPSDAGYTDCLEACTAKLDTAADALESARIFDIRIVDAQNATTVYQPSGDVKVSIRLAGHDLKNDPQVRILRFDGEDNPEELTTADHWVVCETKPGVREQTIEFTADSLSVCAVIQIKDAPALSRYWTLRPGTALMVYDQKEETGGTRIDADNAVVFKTILQSSDWTEIETDHTRKFAKTEELLDVWTAVTDENVLTGVRSVPVLRSQGNNIVEGESVRLTADLTDFSDCSEVHVTWEINTGDEWIAAGTGETFEYTVTRESLKWMVRARVEYIP